MPSMNKVEIMGHLGQEPEIRHTGSGAVVASLSVATSYKDKQGDEHTEWHRVVAWNTMARQAQSLRKGSLVYVTGRLQTRKWQDKDGKDHWTTEIVAQLLVGANWIKGDSQGQGQGQGRVQSSSGTAKPADAGGGDFEDDIPF